jgi:hypothetical protein
VQIFCESLFLHYNQIPKGNTLKEEKFILAQGFRSFSTRLAVSIALGIGKADYHGSRKMVEQSSLRHSRQEAKGDRKGLGQDFLQAPLPLQ